MSEPLSPHLQIYRWQITSALSIFHRFSGIALALAMPLYVLWLAAVALGEPTYGLVQVAFGSFLGRCLLFGLSLALAYHLLNGVRHLLWDVGMGFSRPAVVVGAAVVSGGTLGLVGVAWLLAVFGNG